MSNPNAARGRRWEKDVFDFLLALFGRAGVRRPHQEGFRDVGDLHLSPFALQLKDEAKHSFSSYVDDAELQAGHAGEAYGAAVVKRRRLGTGRAYVVLSLDTFVRVVARLRRAEELLLRSSPEAYDSHASQTEQENS